MFQIAIIPPEEPFLRYLARRLIADAGCDPCGLASDLVLLPSIRACASLRHLLLEESGENSLLLPTALTPGRLRQELAARTPETGPAAVPAGLRASVLAPALAKLPWLRSHPESATGLAEELVDLFDELRRHGIDPAKPAGEDQDAGDPLARDLDRVAEAWLLYREMVPRDDIDIEVELVRAAAAGWPDLTIGRLVVAGFVTMTPTTTVLLRAAAEKADKALLVMTGAEGDGPLSRLFTASFGDLDAETHPAHPAARTVAALTRVETPERGRDKRSYRERIDGLGDIAGLFDQAGFPRLAPCSDPESESREIAAKVIERLRLDPRSRIAVASPDRGLARRVAAQLRDAGLTNIDDSGGSPLSTHAEGRLAWFLLRAATTDLNHEALLEVLTHPDVDFGRPRGDFSSQVLGFEKHVMHGEIAPGGLDGYRRLADRKIEKSRTPELKRAAQKSRQFIEAFAPAFTGLAELAGRSRIACADIVAELRRAWNIAAPEKPLAGEDDTESGSAQGLVELARLLDEIDAAASVLPEMSLADFSALLSRLMARVEVRSHRPAFLPVRITGLLEARLENYDLLILGGMSEDVFPGRETRPLFLGQAWRRKAGLRDWRRRLGEQADLFQRLLHNGSEVVLTWPLEKDGRRTLPSPMISRLTLGLDTEDLPRIAAGAPLYRKQIPDTAALSARQKEFIAEGAAPRLHGARPGIEKVSHSSLSVFRACPYRFLLERGFGMREEEEILDELRARDVGQTAHLIMKDFLAPGSEGRTAIENGDEQVAAATLTRIARENFGREHGALPQLALWEKSFLKLVDDIVASEIERAPAWRPAALEASFCFTLGDLHAWLDSPADIELDGAESAVEMTGRIDRIDLATDGSGAAMVIDYKTGKPPNPKEVAEQRDLQLPIYAIGTLIGAGKTPAASSIAGGAYYGLFADGVGCAKPQLADDSDLHDQGRTILATALAAVRCDGPFPLVPDEWGEADPKACAYCPFRGVCRYDERLLDPASAADGGGS